MKLPYENELYELRKWIDFTNANLHMQFLHTPQEIQRVYQWINAITRGIQADYPFYATTLPCVANILFQQNEVGAIFLNPAAHANLQYEKREAMEQIMLASQLMYVLDKPQL